jgi:tetraacyldisaccharide-1-P 4'-kinase
VTTQPRKAATARWPPSRLPVVVVGLETTGCAGVTPSAQLLVQTVKTI